MEWQVVICVNTIFFFIIVKTILKEFGKSSLRNYFFLLFGTSGFYFLLQDPSETSLVASYFFLLNIVFIKKIEEDRPFSKSLLFLNIALGVLMRKYMGLFVIPFIPLLLFKKKKEELLIVSGAIIFACSLYLFLDYLRHDSFSITHSARYVSSLMGLHFFERLFGAKGFFFQSPVVFISFLGLCYFAYNGRNRILATYSIASLLLINYCVSLFPVGDNIPARNILVIVPGLFLGLEVFKKGRLSYAIMTLFTGLGFLNHAGSMLYYGNKRDPRVLTLFEKIINLPEYSDYFLDFFNHKIYLLKSEFFAVLILIVFLTILVFIILNLYSLERIKVFFLSTFLIAVTLSITLDYLRGNQNGERYCSSFECYNLNRYDSMFFEMKIFYEISSTFKASGVDLKFDEKLFWSNYCNSVKEKRLLMRKDCLPD